MFDVKHAALAGLLLCSPAYAESLTNEQALGIFGALSALDGYEKVLKDGASEKAVKVPYDFGGGLRLVIAQDMVALKPKVDAYTTAHNALIMQLSNGKGDFKDNPKGEIEAQDQTLTMLSAKIDVGLTHIREPELKLDENRIPPSILAGLLPILDEK